MFDIRSSVRRQLLAYYFSNPEARLHLRDLAGRLGVDPSNLSKEMRRLERDGLFRSEVSGRQKYFQLNRDYGLFDEVRGIVMKTVGVGPALAEWLAKIGAIDEAWLYGSFARGDYDAASDVDVLIVGGPNSENLAKGMRGLEKQLGRDINYTVLTAKEFRLRRESKDPFLENVWRNERLLLVGAHGKVQVSPDGLGASRALSGERREEGGLRTKNSRVR